METRKCPVCDKDITYKLRSNYLKAVRKNQICRQCYHNTLRERFLGSGNPFFGKKHSESTLSKMQLRQHPHVKEEWFRRQCSERYKGSGNPMYGRSDYQIWVQKFGKEKADELECNRRKKLSEASKGSNNPMYGKPTPNGSGNGWSGWYHDWYFRSLRELSYMINVIEKQKLRWRTADTKDLRINYVNWNGVARTYSADFLIEEKYLIEVKPIKLKSSIIVRLKEEAAIEFCARLGLEYKIVDAPVLSQHIICDLYRNGDIKLLPRYEKLFLERYFNDSKNAAFGGDDCQR